MERNIVWQNTKISKKHREELLNQKGVVLWFTGLSGAGKSTIASFLEEFLIKRGKLTYLLDGDNLRHGLNKDLSFSYEDRKENIRRVSEVCKLFQDSGIITIASFISPSKEDRYMARNIIGDNFIEVFVKCPLDVCERRDPKGLYKKARNGEIKDFTGIDSEYEEPDNSEIVIDTYKNSIMKSLSEIIYILEKKNLI
ncbi:adenylyl-sulfate kinase [Clostridium nigeriense]|uniref:adenylyl-sulfate kinase n=1 Tax=Clostridium nigeriense TaxID=1805470 RepID=UPI003D346FEE